MCVCVPWDDRGSGCMCANIKIPYYYYTRQCVLEIGREIGRKREILKREREREKE